MRPGLMHPRLAAVLAGMMAAVLPCGPVMAQDSATKPALAAAPTLNQGALDLLPAPRAPVRQPTRKPAAPRGTVGAQPRSAPHAATPANKPADVPMADQTAKPVPPAAPAAPPALPVVPPAIAALPPPAPVPPPRPQAAPIVPIAPDAPGVATPLPNGVRVTFGPNRQELNPTTQDALRDIAARLKANDNATVNIYAYAAGTPEDASVARRLSLARAMAARAVLVNEGVASIRIYPRALGSAGGDAGQDRIDVVIGLPGPPAPVQPARLAVPDTGPKTPTPSSRTPAP